MVSTQVFSLSHTVFDTPTRAKRDILPSTTSRTPLDPYSVSLRFVGSWVRWVGRTPVPLRFRQPLSHTVPTGSSSAS